jgi:hypothetical protein
MTAKTAAGINDALVMGRSFAQRASLSLVCRLRATHCIVLDNSATKSYILALGKLGAFNSHGVGT